MASPLSKHFRTGVSEIHEGVQHTVRVSIGPNGMSTPALVLFGGDSYVPIAAVQFRPQTENSRSMIYQRPGDTFTFHGLINRDKQGFGLVGSNFLEDVNLHFNFFQNDRALNEVNVLPPMSSYEVSSAQYNDHKSLILESIESATGSMLSVRDDEVKAREKGEAKKGLYISILICPEKGKATALFAKSIWRAVDSFVLTNRPPPPPPPPPPAIHLPPPGDGWSPYRGGGGGGYDWRAPAALPGANWGGGGGGFGFATPAAGPAPPGHPAWGPGGGGGGGGFGIAAPAGHPAWGVGAAAAGAPTVPSWGALPPTASSLLSSFGAARPPLHASSAARSEGKSAFGAFGARGGPAPWTFHSASAGPAASAAAGGFSFPASSRSEGAVWPASTAEGFGFPASGMPFELSESNGPAPAAEAEKWIGDSKASQLAYGTRMTVQTQVVSLEFDYDLKSAPCVLGLSVMEAIEFATPVPEEEAAMRTLILANVNRKYDVFLKTVKPYTSAECCICLENEPPLDTVFFKCAHACAHYACTATINACPLCRETIAAKLRVPIPIAT